MRSKFKVWIHFSISDVSVRELLHFMFDFGSVVYNKNLQDRIFIIHHAGILLSHSGWDVSILHPRPHVALTPMLSYPTELLFMTTTNKQIQLNKLPLITIIFRIVYGTVRLITPKYKRTHLVQYVSVVTASKDTLTFYFRFEMPNILFLEHTCIAKCLCSMSIGRWSNVMGMIYEGSCLFRKPYM